MVEQVLLVLQVGFVVLLYLFVWRVVRARACATSAARAAGEHGLRRRATPGGLAAAPPRRRPRGPRLVVSRARPTRQARSCLRRYASCSAARPRTTWCSRATRTPRAGTRACRPRRRRRYVEDLGLDATARSWTGSALAAEHRLRRGDELASARPSCATRSERLCAIVRDRRGHATPAASGATTRTRTSSTRRCSSVADGMGGAQRRRGRLAPGHRGADAHRDARPAATPRSRCAAPSARPTGASTSARAHDPHAAGMGTTVTAALVNDGRDRVRPRRRLARLPAARRRAAAALGRPLAGRRARARGALTPEEAARAPAALGHHARARRRRATSTSTPGAIDGAGRATSSCSAPTGSRHGRRRGDAAHPASGAGAAAGRARARAWRPTPRAATTTSPRSCSASATAPPSRSDRRAHRAEPRPAQRCRSPSRAGRRHGAAEGAGVALPPARSCSPSLVLLLRRRRRARRRPGLRWAHFVGASGRRARWRSTRACLDLGGGLKPVPAGRHAARVLAATLPATGRAAAVRPRALRSSAAAPLASSTQLERDGAVSAVDRLRSSAQPRARHARCS